ncbi:two-component regulator propeller domain-containing protein [Algicola sagamiensis]|uniref:two-component regulator propeller domain-containing protein n=1 Tax=Algicola sagamiensis TaxID=163869 RepID=UPI00036C40B8|nr:two-component regulator propeller domain-containing protein [Algicola sagamiensis]
MCWNQLRTCLLLSLLFCGQAYASVIDVPSLPKAITQDARGFVWIALEDGIARYDGYSFVHQRKFSPNAKLRNIFSIKPYLTTVIFSGEGGVFTVAETGEVITLLETSGIIYDVAVVDDKVFALTDNKLIIRNIGGFPINHGVDISIQGIPRGITQYKNDIYYLTSEKVCSYKTDRCHTGRFSELKVIQDKLVVAGRHGLTIIDPVTWIPQSFLIGQVDSLTSSVEENSGQVWMVHNKEIALFDLNNQRLVNHNYKRISSLRIFDIFQTSDGSIWLATNEVERISPSIFSVQQSSITEASGAGGGLVYHDGSLYFGDINGLEVVDPVTAQATPISGAPSFIYRMLSHRQGLFIGSFYGLFLLQDGRFSHLSIQQPVFCLRLIDENTLIVCHGGQVSEIDLSNDFQVTSQEYERYFNGEEIVDILPGKTPWIATANGVTRIVDQKREFISYDSTLALYRPQSFPQYTFLGTANTGVAIIRNGILQRKILLPGIGGKCSYFTEWRGAVWVGCSKGVLQIQLDDMTFKAFDAGASVGNITRIHDRFYAMTANSQLLSWDHAFYEERGPLRLMLSNVFVNGKLADLNEPLQGEHIEFQVALNDFHGSARYNFYVNGKLRKLHSTERTYGFNADWGTNTFSVEGINSLGESVSKDVQFYVQYPMYLRPFAFLCYIIFLILVCSYLWYSGRKRNQLKEALHQTRMSNKVNGFQHLLIDYFYELYPHQRKIFEECTMLYALSKSRENLLPKVFHNSIERLYSLLKSDPLRTTFDFNIDLAMAAQKWKEQRQLEYGSDYDTTIELDYEVSDPFTNFVNIAVFIAMQQLGDYALSYSADHVEITIKSYGSNLILNVVGENLSDEGTSLDGKGSYLVKNIVELFQGTFTETRGKKGRYAACLKLPLQVLYNWNEVPERNSVNFPKESLLDLS